MKICAKYFTTGYVGLQFRPCFPIKRVVWNKAPSDFGKKFLRQTELKYLPAIFLVYSGFIVSKELVITTGSF